MFEVVSATPIISVLGYPLAALSLPLLNAILGAAGLLLVVPAAFFFFECFLACLPERRESAGGEAAPPFAVLVPAHNEAGFIGDTVRALMAECRAGDALVVVADNCTDSTAAEAKAAGATVLERTEPEKRGKGFALAFGMEHLAKAPPPVVIIVDADCRAAPGALETLARDAHRAQRPVQADYLLAAPSASAKSVVSALAILVKNRVRPRGLDRLGLPCQLGGSGMAFPFEVLAKAPPLGSHLVEDLVLGIELTVLGHPPLFCKTACVTSFLPEHDSAAAGQRRRWEHGFLSTMISEGPRVLWAGVSRARLDLLALGLDLMVPPLSLLVLLSVAASTGGAVLSALLGAHALLEAGVSALALVLLGVLAAWLRYGRAVIPFGALLSVPRYVLWKIPMYLSFFKKRQQAWERTERDTKRPEP